MDVSFIVIGYNEAAFLNACLSSIRDADLHNVTYEVIYVDGGSQDDSLQVAKAMGVDKLLGGEKRRRAAENRNLGLGHAKGEFVQFLDGDMALVSDWPKSALAFLRSNPDIAAVCADIKETNPSILFKALQIDWQQTPGEVEACGGAAMWRIEVLRQVNGFPETVSYGEEPYLCWRIRNELNYRIHYLNQGMVFHNLDYKGVGDYFRRNVRVGESYAEIATLCFRTNDRFWLKQAIHYPLWAFFIIISVMLLCFASMQIRIAVALFFFLIFGRKLLQLLNKGHSLAVSMIYTAHLYGSKIPIAWGECRWFCRSGINRSEKSRRRP